MIKINDKIKFEETIIIRNEIETALEKKENIEIDFQNKNIKTTIMVGLFMEVLQKFGLKTFEKYVKLINIQNEGNLNRVIYGTTFLEN